MLPAAVSPEGKRTVVHHRLPKEQPCRPIGFIAADFCRPLISYGFWNLRICVQVIATGFRDLRIVEQEMPAKARVDTQGTVASVPR